MVTAYLGIGSNINNRMRHLEQITEILGGIKGIRITDASSVYETEPVGAIPQRNFYNAVLKINTGLSPQDLLSACNRVEQILGRKRLKKNGPRTADIDILLYGSLRGSSKTLTIPHPKMAGRRFVLVPLSEICPGVNIPGAGRADKVLKELKDGKRVTKAGGK